MLKCAAGQIVGDWLPPGKLLWQTPKMMGIVEHRKVKTGRAL